MDTIRLEGKIVALLKTIYDSLDAKAYRNYSPVRAPRVTASGVRITTINQVANALHTDKKVAALYVLEDPTTSVELKELARDELRPGIYVAAEDGYLPAIHRAYTIVKKVDRGEREFKKIKMVRTVSGMRRFGQQKGSIIIKDGDNPLTGLTALTNDVRGYEKVGDKQGNAYYIGREADGQIVVRNPLDNSKMHAAPTEEEAFTWLNEKVGGNASSDVSPAKTPFDPSPNTDPNDDEARDIARDELGRADAQYNLSTSEAAAIDNLDNAGLAAYKLARDRGLPHATAYRQALKGGAKPAPKPAPKGKK